MDELADQNIEPNARRRLDSNPLIAIFAASFASGPVLLVFHGICIVVGYIGSGRFPPRTLGFEVALAAPSLLLAALLFGAMLTCLPNAVGGIVLALVGASVPKARLWALWLLTGAIGAWSIALCIGIHDLST